MEIKVQNFGFNRLNKVQSNKEEIDTSNITLNQPELPEPGSGTLQAYSNISFTGKIFGRHKIQKSSEDPRVNVIIDKLRNADGVFYEELKDDVYYKKNCESEDLGDNNVHISFINGEDHFSTTIIDQHPKKLKVYQGYGSDPIYIKLDENKSKELKQIALSKIEQKFNLPNKILNKALKDPVSILSDKRLDLNWKDSSYTSFESVEDMEFITEYNAKTRFKEGEFRISKHQHYIGDNVYTKHFFYIYDGLNRTRVNLPVNDQIFDEAEKVIKNKMDNNDIENKKVDEEGKLLNLDDYR